MGNNKRAPAAFEPLKSDSLLLSDKSSGLSFSLLAQATAILEESLEMFIDIPMAEFGSPVYVVAHRGAVSSTAADRPQKMGVCAEYVENGTGAISPVFVAEKYFRKYKAGPNVVDGTNHIREDVVVAVNSRPSHGVLELSFPDAVDSSRYDFHYIPDKDYLGEDHFSFIVQVDGKVLRIYYQVKVFSSDENPNYVGFCNWRRPIWKISDASFVSDPLNIADGSIIHEQFKAAGVQLGNFLGSKLGQTTTTGADAWITIDTDAAGREGMTSSSSRPELR